MNKKENVYLNKIIVFIKYAKLFWLVKSVTTEDSKSKRHVLLTDRIPYVSS
jgi:nitrogen fixation-related uncharacterized protein